MAQRRTWMASRRMVSTIGIVAAGVLVLPSGHAAADPLTDAKKKLNDLNERADKIVDQYNQVTVDLKKATKRLVELDRRIASDEARFNELREKVAQLAAAAYQTGDVASFVTMLSGTDPQAMIDQASSLNQLSATRMAEMDSYLDAAKVLQRSQRDARVARDEVKKLQTRLKRRKGEIERLITKQRALLDRLQPEAAPSPPPPQGGSYNGPASGPARAALDYAYAQLGKPYVYGGTGPGGYDCSGLTMMSWRAAGVSLPRTTYSQYNAGPHVAKENLQPGDLIFSNGLGHVGMYVGNNKMIHSPQTGGVVEVVTLDSYWWGSYNGAVRP